MIKYPLIKFWEHFKSTNGAMSCSEAIFMYNACLEVPKEGIKVEMGTAYGKSALVTLMAWLGREKEELFLLEPEFKNLDWLNVTQSNILKFKSHFIDSTVCLFTPKYSTDFLPELKNYSYIMWDSGSHGSELVDLELPLIRSRMVSGGILVMHDVFSQFTACTNAYKELIASGEFEPIIYDWGEINEYVMSNNLEDGNISWHQYPELSHSPNFIGALRKK